MILNSCPYDGGDSSAPAGACLHNVALRAQTRALSWSKTERFHFYFLIHKASVSYIRLGSWDFFWLLYSQVDEHSKMTNLDKKCFLKYDLLLSKLKFRSCLLIQDLLIHHQHWRSYLV